MSLLQETIDGVRYEYQLDLSFDKQLETLDKVGTLYDYTKGIALPQFAETWSFIKEKISIFEINGDSESVVWKKGKKVDESCEKMLSYSIASSKFFLKAFGDFMKGQGVNL